ncbi:hypothetical protein IWZ01DRAFT_254992 [Phyllosticta capitalensis]
MTCCLRKAGIYGEVRPYANHSSDGTDSAAEHREALLACRPASSNSMPNLSQRKIGPSLERDGFGRYGQRRGALHAYGQACPDGRSTNQQVQTARLTYHSAKSVHHSRAGWIADNPGHSLHRIADWQTSRHLQDRRLNNRKARCCRETWHGAVDGGACLPSCRPAPTLTACHHLWRRSGKLGMIFPLYSGSMAVPRAAGCPLSLLMSCRENARLRRY